jgi:hypothetical protein
VDLRKITVTVTAPEDQLRSFTQLCKTIQWLCQAGASRTIVLPVDGDGSGHMTFDFGALDHSAVKPADVTDDDQVRVAGIGG